MITVKQVNDRIKQYGFKIEFEYPNLCYPYFSNDDTIPVESRDFVSLKDSSLAIYKLNHMAKSDEDKLNRIEFMLRDKINKSSSGYGKYSYNN